jgi:hypothetical protein
MNAGRIAMLGEVAQFALGAGRAHYSSKPALELRTGWGGSVRRRALIPSIPQVPRLAEALDHLKLLA